MTAIRRFIDVIFIEPKKRQYVILHAGEFWQLPRMHLTHNAWLLKKPYTESLNAIFVAQNQAVGTELSDILTTYELPEQLGGLPATHFLAWWQTNDYKWLSEKGVLQLDEQPPQSVKTPTQPSTQTAPTPTVSTTVSANELTPPTPTPIATPAPTPSDLVVPSPAVSTPIAPPAKPQSEPPKPAPKKPIQPTQAPTTQTVDPAVPNPTPKQTTPNTPSNNKVKDVFDDLLGDLMHDIQEELIHQHH